MLNKAEQNYSTIEKELLTIVWAVHKFRPYVYGHRFVVITDHKPLQWVFSVKDPSSRILRWRIKLNDYDSIIHKPGRKRGCSISRVQIPCLYCFAIKRPQAKGFNVHKHPRPQIEVVG